MGKLSDNWISEGWVDFEYKKYLLLAYLQDVEKDFKSVKLYPPLAELIHHYQKLENLDKTRNEFKKQIEEGKSIYEFIEDQLEIEPVGLSALYQKEGYALVSNGNSKDILVYRYKIDLFQNSLDKYRGIVLRFVAAFRKSLNNTCNRIKLDLIKNFTDLPNPSTWRIYSKQDVPLQESLLPISKRLLLRNISV